MMTNFVMCKSTCASTDDEDGGEMGDSAEWSTGKKFESCP